MTRRYQILLASHLLVFGTAYAVSGIKRGTSAPGSDRLGSTLSSKSTVRDRQLPTGDGSRLLGEFMEEKSRRLSRYEELKASLPVADDPKGAAVMALEALVHSLSRELPPDETRDLSPIFEVRALHWMMRSPEEAMAFFVGYKEPYRESLLALLSTNVVMEVAMEKGILASLPWLTQSPATLPMIRDVTLAEMNAGGGLALYLAVEKAMAGGAGLEDRGDFFQSVGKATRFHENEKLLELVERQEGDRNKTHLLSGFAESGPEAASWVMGIIARGDLEDGLAGSLKSAMGEVVLRSPSLPWDQRVEARRATEGNAEKSRQEIINELVRGDIDYVFNNGRDWRYEFRHGQTTVDEVMEAVRKDLPGISAAEEETMIVSVYRHLSEEDSAKALSLLDSLPEDRRRDALFNSTWQNFGNISPDDFLDFHRDVPEPVTAEERDLRTKGWNWKARGFLARYGDDYVEWVKEMPPGLDKDTAMNSLIWATREQDPAKARELGEQLYPKNK